MSEEDPNAAFSPLVYLLASCTPDIYSRGRRRECELEAQESAKGSEACREFLATCKDLACTSRHAYGRIIPILTVSLGAYKDVSKQDATSDQESIVQGLVLNLCRMVKFSGQHNLQQEYILRWKPFMKETLGTLEGGTLMADTFFNVAKGNTDGLWSTAIALGFDLEDTLDWSAVFLEQAFGNNTLPKQREMESLEPFVASVFQKADGAWPKDWLDTLLLKLKANPEGGMETLWGFVLVILCTPGASLPWQTEPEFVAALLKQMQSAKDNLRDMACKILSTASHHIASCATVVVPAVQAQGSKATTTTAPQRRSLYQLFSNLALGIMGNNSSWPIDKLDQELPKVLQVISNLLGKEGKSATDAREEGMAALWYWWRVAKRNNPNADSKTLDAVLSLLRKPLATKNGSETVAIVGHFLHSINDPDAIESMTMDLLGGKKDAALEKGLDGIISSAIATTTAKKPTSSVEGLIVVYLGLVYAMAVGGSTQAFLTKAWKASPNFVLSAPMLDALNSSNRTTSSLVRFILPRVLALSAKWTGSEDKATDVPFKSGPAARALAACVTNPNANNTKQSNHELTSKGKKRKKFQPSTPPPTPAMRSTTQTVLKYQPKVALDMAGTLWTHVNDRANEAKELIEAFNAAQQGKEDQGATTSDAYNNWNMDYNAIRVVAYQPLGTSIVGGNALTAPMLAQVLVLMHVGSTMRDDGHQRNNLRRRTLNVLKLATKFHDDKEFAAALAMHIAQCAAESKFQWNSDGKDTEPAAVSDIIHRATLSLMVSLGSIGADYLISAEMEMDEEDTEEGEEKDEVKMKASEFASNLCTKEIPSRLRDSMANARAQVEALSKDDVDLLMSSMGTLHDSNAKAADVEGPTTKAARGKNKGISKEDEEWELQMKKELAEKKKKETAASGNSTRPLTADEKKQVASQDQERERMSCTVHGDFKRTLAAIRSLCMSDIEIGSACLPIFSEVVLAAAVSKCAAFAAIRDLGESAFKTLTTLAASVYEIHEENAAALATALTVSCRVKIEKQPKADKEGAPVLMRKDSKQDDENTLSVSALPSPCASAALAISEMEDLHAPVSGNSFVLLFPIIRAALTGPRTSQGCDAALRVLEWHTPLLAGDEADPVVTPLRKSMVVSVLELMKHDRAQTFLNPSPNEALVACFRTESNGSGGAALSTAELAPLLDDRGALGGKTCRAGAMIALRHIALEHEGLIKKNPLIENRIWLNCFDENETIRLEARRAWKAIHGELDEDMSEEDILAITKSPSLMYAAPLLPLLNNSDPSIAKAAAEAYAKGMALHPKSVSKNIQKLCNSYIDAYPAAASGSKKAEQAFPAALPPKKAPVAPVKKKPVGLGLPKKKTTTKKGALSVAGIGKAGGGKKKKSSALTAAMMKPKQERTLGQADLASQFQTSTAVQTTANASKEESKDSPDKIAARLGILQAVTALTKADGLQMDVPTLKMLTSFLMAYGIAESDEVVKSSARNALRDVVASNGDSDEAIAFLLPHLDAVLKAGNVSDQSALGALSSEKVPKDVDSCDRRKEGAVVALGSVALHLKGPENASKIDDTIDMLIATLKTPSEEVQSSVAECLAKLMKKGNTKDRIETLLNNLLQECLQGETLASRRGAAYGLSAAVKGSGIATLKKYAIVKQLEEACASGGANSKEGSLFAIELLSVRLGLLFEPYVIVLLPSLLRAFSDSSDYVRKAASDTCGLIMSKLSAHGVKLVMPAVLTAFNDPAWRTKQASIRMLGAMSHLAPKQLASALPKVVPKLTEAFGDTHPKVKSTAQEALDEISTVVRNPEISSISQLLLKALTDPADHTTAALEGLIETEFLHAIDAPSLALIVPILHRGLRDRAASTKRYGALIAGNICTMINDSRDFVPYLPTLLPDLKTTLLDPIPDVRSTSAKAFGSLTRGLGDSIVNELRPWLIEKLGDPECSSAERSGAANGLTEVLVAAGTNVVEEAMLEEILPLRNHPEASTREGVLWMLTYLPPTLGQGFTPLMDASLPALIGGLSDEGESVREVAMRAGRVLIRSHGKVHVDKILPSLENGLVDDDYRIRLASLTLLGDLLSTIGGTTLLIGDGDTREDIRRAERAQAQIALTLGHEKRKRVLSGLYLARSDNVSMVRHHAVQVWKTVVSVTARTLKDILPVLVGQVVVGLASGDPERTLVAGKCLGEIVTKLGDTVLPEIIPVLRTSLSEGDTNTKRGVCVGLTEVIKCSTKEQILRFIDIIVKLVQDALCDDDEEVCQMAASSFQSLYSVVGNRAMEEVLPSLMVALETSYDEESRTRAMNGLTGIMRVRSKELLPYVVPRLLQKPVTKSHAEALTGIAKVTGGTIQYHFSSIIPTFLGELSAFRVSKGDDDDKEREAAIRECCKAICGSVEEAGVSVLVSEIASKCSNEKPEIRAESCWFFETALTERAAAADIYEFVPTIMRELIYRLNDETKDVLTAAHKAWKALSQHVPAEESVKHIEFMRNLINSMVSESRRRKGGVGDGEFFLPGFNIPKGLEPMLPIYQRGILYGSATIREVSASGLGEVISLTSNKFLAGPVIIKMTGPLLRVVGDRNPSNVKIAILRTLGLILVKGGPALRAFVPQFQTTFVKALSDPSRQVRLEAIQALSLLMPLSTRVDPLIKELVAGSLGKNTALAADATGGAIAAVQTATLEALAAVLRKGGKKAKLPDTIRSAFDASKELLENEDESVRESSAKVMGASVELMDPSIATEVLQDEILVADADDPGGIKHGKACAIRQLFASTLGPGFDQSLKDTAVENVLAYMNDEKGAVKVAGCVAFGAAVSRSDNPSDSLAKLEPVLLEIMGNARAPLEVHRALAAGFCILLQLVDCGDQDNVQFLGKTLMDAILQTAMSGSQRVQLAFNDVLWLALDVSGGQAGLDRYAGIAQFENVKAMRGLHSKVLARIKEVTILDDY